MRRITLALLLAPLGFLNVDAALAAKAPKSANGPLLKLFDATWQEDLEDNPLAATALGDARYNDRLPDMTQVAIDARQKKNYSRLQALAKIKREKLSKEDQLNYDLFERDRERNSRLIDRRVSDTPGVRLATTAARRARREASHVELPIGGAFFERLAEHIQRPPVELRDRGRTCAIPL